MNITKIELQNFRNYKKLKMDKFSNLNIIIGDNGIGKTSILESIYFCSLTKTFKTNNEINIIKENEEFTKIKIQLLTDISKKNIEMIFSKAGKKANINGSLQKKLSDFISQYKVLLYSPDEIKIIKSSPNIRRTYFNIQISQLNKEYIIHLNNYNILIKNKNEYLKKLMLNNYLDTKYLDVLDKKIVDEGLYIYNERLKYVNQINKYIGECFNNFSKNVVVKVIYESDYKNNDKEKLLKELLHNRKKEIIFGMTDYGIHRDDFVFMYNEQNVKEFCSQGIQKLILLSLKLAETKIFVNEYNYQPILLLDDLFSELDENNKNKIFKSLNKYTQIFITTTDIRNINKKIVEKAKIYNLNERKYNE